MEDFLTNHFEAILSFIGGCITGGIGVRLYSKENCNNSKSILKNITTKGDVAGRDINKK